MGRGLHFVSSEISIAVMGFSTVILLLVGVAAFTQAKSVSKSATTEDNLKRLIRLLKGDKVSPPYSGYGSYGYGSGSGNYDFSSSGSGDSYGSYSGSGDYSGSYGSYSSGDYGSGSGSYGSYSSDYGSDYSGSGNDDQICIPEWVAYHIESMLWEHQQYVSGSGYGSGSGDYSGSYGSYGSGDYSSSGYSSSDYYGSGSSSDVGSGSGWLDSWPEWYGSGSGSGMRATGIQMKKTQEVKDVKKPKKSNKPSPAQMKSALRRALAQKTKRGQMKKHE